MDIAITPAEAPGPAFGRAWVALTAVLAAHVVDEALTGFLEVYNPIVLAARARLPWFPMPVFTFGVWLAGLCVLVAVLCAASPLAYKRSPIARRAAYPYGVIMLLNGAGHLAGSIYLQRWAPGATTAPLLLAASVWLLITVRR
jgi:uncharacterized protein with HXXEE motif